LSQKIPCVIFGENEPICIDFHHVGVGEKEFTVGKHRNLNKDRLLKEISKCVCLCTNCHRKIHAGLIKINNV
jgi:predicted HNH restriction endonuclease